MAMSPSPTSGMNGSKVAATLAYIGSKSDRFFGTAPRNYATGEVRQTFAGERDNNLFATYLDHPLPTRLGVEEGKVDDELVECGL